MTSLPGGAERGRSLRSQFIEFRNVLGYGSVSTLESIVATLAEELQAIASLHTPLALRCADLEAQLVHLLTRWRAEPPCAGEIPF